MRLRVAEPHWAAAVLKLCLAPRFPEERAYYIKSSPITAKGCGEKFGGIVGSGGMSRVRTSEEANSASVRVSHSATNDFV